MTKLPEELHHILGELAHPSPAFCGFGELGSYVIGLIYSLACTERAFDLISLSNSPGHYSLPFRAGRFLRRPSERSGVSLDVEVFQYSPVGLVHVDFVGMDGSGQTAEALHVFVDVRLRCSYLHYRVELLQNKYIFFFYIISLVSKENFECVTN